MLRPLQGKPFERLESLCRHGRTQRHVQRWRLQRRLLLLLLRRRRRWRDSLATLLLLGRRLHIDRVDQGARLALMLPCLILPCLL